MTTNDSSGKKFAIYARVSTEGQAATGGSLDIQVRELKQTVKKLKGIIVPGCEYVGNEHTLYNRARVIFDKFIQDCYLKKFEAVAVTDAARFGRNQADFLKWKLALIENNICLYIGDTQKDLNNIMDSMFFDFSNHLERQGVESRLDASYKTKIDRVKRNFHSSKKREVWGRILTNPKAKKDGIGIYKIDPDKQDLINKIYDLYINKGENLTEISKVFGISKTTLRDILIKYSGEKIKVHFKSRGFDEFFYISVPPLLTEDQRSRVMEKASDNKKYGHVGRTYPLSGYISCANCGCQLNGFQSESKSKSKSYHDKVYVYYYHKPQLRTDDRCIKIVDARLIETETCNAIYSMLSDEVNLREAIGSMIQGYRKEVMEIESKIEATSNEIKKIDSKIKLWETAYEKDQDVEVYLEKTVPLKQIRINLKEEIEKCKSIRKNANSNIPENLKEMIYAYGLTFLDDKNLLNDFSLETKKDIFEVFFGSRNKKRGVKVFKKNNEEVYFEVNGILGHCSDYLSEMRSILRSVTLQEKIYKKMELQTASIDELNELVKKICSYLKPADVYEPETGKKRIIEFKLTVYPVKSNQ